MFATIGKRWATAIIAIIGMVALAPGCASGQDEDRTGGGQHSPVQLSFEEYQLKYAQCMREQGVDDYPDPNQPGGVIKIDDQDKYADAQKVCVAKLGESPADPNAPDPAEQSKENAKMLKCLRANGVEIPKAKPGDDVQPGIPTDIDPQIMKKCGLKEGQDG
ncbi:hypothetical protein EB835_18505 [Brevibacterium sp. S22]|nr:hypothetical protein EB835_18505 [Brevibacterium sp. S22]